MNGKTYDTLPQHWWYIPTELSCQLLTKAGYKSNADLPRIVASLNSDSRKVMLQAFMLADGDKRGHFHKAKDYVLEAFEILCALEGFATGTRKRRPSVTVITKKKTRHVAGSFLTLDAVDDQPAWCPTTKYGTWIMRQNGRVTITGNTKAKRRVTLSFVGLSILDESELDTMKYKVVE